MCLLVETGLRDIGKMVDKDQKISRVVNVNLFLPYLDLDANEPGGYGEELRFE